MKVTAHHTPEQLLQRYTTEPQSRLARRIHGIYLASRGLTCPEVMQITGAGRRTVQQWAARYNQSGIEGLKDKPRPGTPRKLPVHLEKRFRRRIEAGPQKRDGVSVLKGPAIQRILEREFGVLYSLRAVQLLLHRLGYSCLCPRPQHENVDPQLQERLKKTSLKGSPK